MSSQNPNALNNLYGHLDLGQLHNRTSQLFNAAIGGAAFRGLDVKPDALNDRVTIGNDAGALTIGESVSGSDIVWSLNQERYTLTDPGTYEVTGTVWTYSDAMRFANSNEYTAKAERTLAGPVLLPDTVNYELGLPRLMTVADQQLVLRRIHEAQMRKKGTPDPLTSYLSGIVRRAAAAVRPTRRRVA